MSGLEDVRAFVKTAETGSFASAAVELNVTPSALSKLVSRLEDRLGVRLMHRTTRRLALTTEGELYLARAAQILADVDELDAEVAKSRGAPRGRLRVNTSNGFGVHQLAPVLPDFLSRYPEVQVELSITDHIVSLMDDRYDVAIRVGTVPEGSLAAVKIGEIERTICAAPSYLAKHGVPEAPTDLLRHACVGLAPQAPHRWPFHGPGGLEIVTLTPSVTTDNAECALKLALAGAGIIRLGDVVVGDALRAGTLVPLLTETHHAEPLPLSAISLAGRRRIPKVRVFIEFLLERFTSQPWRR